MPLYIVHFVVPCTKTLQPSLVPSLKRFPPAPIILPCAPKPAKHIYRPRKKKQTKHPVCCLSWMQLRDSVKRTEWLKHEEHSQYLVLLRERDLFTEGRGCHFSKLAGRVVKELLLINRNGLVSQIDSARHVFTTETLIVRSRNKLHYRVLLIYLCSFLKKTLLQTAFASSGTTLQEKKSFWSDVGLNGRKDEPCWFELSLAGFPSACFCACLCGF